MTEDQFQSQCWQWAWNTYPLVRRVFWAVPNGGDRDIKTATTLQATGVLSGVHDLHLLWDGQFYTFELKVGDNKMTTDTIITTSRGAQRKRYGQVEWGEAMAKQGGVWFEVRPSSPGFVTDPISGFKILFTEVMEGRWKRCKIIK